MIRYAAGVAWFLLCATGVVGLAFVIVEGIARLSGFLHRGEL